MALCFMIMPYGRKTTQVEPSSNAPGEIDFNALWDKAFAPTELSDCGLPADHARALTVQKRLRVEYPDEPHADCYLWAIWQMKTGQR